MTYGRYFGGYATQVQQPHDFFFKLPENFKLNLGSPLFCAGITTFYPIQKYYKPGMKCAVVGIGGLGHLALKFLHKLGAYTAAFTTSEKKIQSIKDLGADEVIVSTKEQEMKNAMGKFDLLLYTIPNVEKFEMYLATVAKKGTCVLLGVGENNDIKFNYFPLLKKEIKVVGSLVGPRGAINNLIIWLNSVVKKMCFPYAKNLISRIYRKLLISLKMENHILDVLLMLRIMLKNMA